MLSNRVPLGTMTLSPPASRRALALTALTALAARPLWTYWS
jgi:hypothetical protein